MIPPMHTVEVLRRTFVKGKIVNPGDIIELDTPDFNAFVYFGKGKKVEVPKAEPPKADERETELLDRMSKRDLPKPAKKEVVDHGKP